MTDAEAFAILNHAFVRVYRSFGQYLREASLDFDVGQETIEAIWERQAADARRLGQWIVREQGSIYSGFYPIEYGDVHFLSSSHVLGDWIVEQEKLVAALDSDLERLASYDGPGVELLAEIAAHERAHLQRIRELHALPVPTPT